MDAICLLASETSTERLSTIRTVILGLLAVTVFIAIGAALGVLAAKLQGVLVVAGIVLFVVAIAAWVFDEKWAGSVAVAGGGCLLFALLGAAVGD